MRDLRALVDIFFGVVRYYHDLPGGEKQVSVREDLREDERFKVGSARKSQELPAFQKQMCYSQHLLSFDVLNPQLILQTIT